MMETAVAVAPGCAVRWPAAARKSRTEPRMRQRRRCSICVALHRSSSFPPSNTGCRLLRTPIAPIRGGPCDCVCVYRCASALRPSGALGAWWDHGRCWALTYQAVRSQTGIPKPMKSAGDCGPRSAHRRGYAAAPVDCVFRSDLRIRRHVAPFRCQEVR